jgi:Leucine-rich repeat (LRR) protein
MGFLNLFPELDKSETLSMASFRSSMSAVSNLSLGGSWWGRPEHLSIDAELKYIYSSFTKLPALVVKAPGHKLITELANEAPNRNALPLDAFKNLQSLECIDIDPRTLLGWDRLAESLRSLKVKKSGLMDVTEIFIGTVVDDQARREGSTSRTRRRRIPSGLTRETPFYSTRLPDTVPEDVEEEDIATPTCSNTDPESHPKSRSSSLPSSITLSPFKWAFLKHLSLSDNALTFFPSESLSYLTSLTHLDLSSNLFVSVPSGLGVLYNLVSLDLSDNMIDTVLGIYTNLGQVFSLNLSNNRLDSICGLERLLALERVDLRNNFIEESAEVGRLATLPNIAAVWVEGNPLVDIEEGYRITCFDYFWKEGKTITLDGSLPGFYEKRNLTAPPPEQMSSSRPHSTAAYSPAPVAVGHSHSHYQLTSSPPIVPYSKYPTPPDSSNTSPHFGPINAIGVSGKERRKKAKRIVELDADFSDATSSTSHRRIRSDESSIRRKVTMKTPRRNASPLPAPSLKPLPGEQTDVVGEGSKATDIASQHSPPSETPDKLLHPALGGANANAENSSRMPLRARHIRSQTEAIPSSSSFAAPDMLPSSNSSVDPSFFVAETPMIPISFRRGSTSLSSKLAVRRARISASVYEPESAVVGDVAGEQLRDDADAYRRRVEALKKDMGDGWLKVFSQSQVKSP